MKRKYEISFTFEGRRPTKEQIEYYLDYWMSENGKSISNLCVTVTKVEGKFDS